MPISTPATVGRVRATYQFITSQRQHYSAETLCRVLNVAPGGYYAWLKQPFSAHAQEDARLLRLIRASITASQGIYGAPRVFFDLREAGETCRQHRVARLMRVNHLRALHDYRMRRWAVGKPSAVMPNILLRLSTKSDPPVMPKSGPPAVDGRSFLNLSTYPMMAVGAFCASTGPAASTAGADQPFFCRVSLVRRNR